MKRKESDRSARSFRNVKRNGSKFIDSARSAYEPDEEFREKHSDAIVPRFYKTLTSKGSPDLIESARIIEVNRFGAYRVRTIESSGEFRAAMKESEDKKGILRRIIESGIKFREASKFSEEDRSECRRLCESAKFREDFTISSNTNNAQTDPFNEFIPIMGGPFNHQLYLHDFLESLAKSFEAWNHNPLAHQIVKITTHFVLGRGVTFKARDPLVQKRFSEWWDKNNMAGRLEFWSDMLSRDGELMIRHFFNKLTRQMFVRWVDSSTVWEIVTDLEDIEQVYYYHQQYPAAFQVLYGAGPDKKFEPTNFGSSKYIINQIPAEEIHHVKINCSPNEKRGRSDLFSILGWLKRYKDFQTAVVLRAIIQSTFAWKNKLNGTDTDVDAFISAFGTDQPEFGSVWVENEASTLSAMTADINSTSGPADCPGIINAIAVGSGIPKEYLGLGDNSARATAVVASEPGVKKFQSRQLTLGRLLKDISQEWFKNEISMGSIPTQQPAKDTGEMVPTDGTIEFDFPEIAIEDRAAKIKDLESALNDKVISHRRFATTFAKELGIEDYGYDEEQNDITEEGVGSMSSFYPSPAEPSDGQPPKNTGTLSGEDKRDIKRADGR